jgi:D-tyrosyl-tRNA(Tyr) deacylase
VAEPLYEAVGQQMAALGAAVRFGSFGAHMAVASVNDGPVTILVDSARTF